MTDQSEPLASAPEHSELGELCGESHSSDTVDNLDIPIAFRKEVRTCTKHFISKFVSYDSLSPSYRVFFISVVSVSIPQDWKEAYLDPNWKATMVEEMKSLAKNEI